MTLNISFENTKSNERIETLKFLYFYGAEKVKVKESPNGYDEYSFTMYADSDEDVKEVLAVLLYYNDRTPEQLAEYGPVFPVRNV